MKLCMYLDVNESFLWLSLLITALAFMRKILWPQILIDYSMKTRLSKSKNPIWKFIFTTHLIIHHHQKCQREFFALRKSLRVMKLLRIASDRVLFRILDNRVSFRFLSDRLFFKILSDRLLTWFFSPSFLVCCYFLSKKGATTFYKKQIF